MFTLGNGGDAAVASALLHASGLLENVLSEKEAHQTSVSQAESKVQNRFSWAVGRNGSAVLVLNSLDPNSQLHFHPFLCARLNKYLHSLSSMANITFDSCPQGANLHTAVCLYMSSQSY